MPPSIKSSLSCAFQIAPDPAMFQRQYFPIVCDVPGTREPEFGLLFQRMETAIVLNAEISSHPHVHLITSPVPRNGVLVSLPQDTVDEDGMPTRLIEKARLEKRRRFSFHPDTMAMHRFDVSFKDVEKTVFRREWEGNAGCFTSGEQEARNKVIRDVPQVAAIRPESFRVLGTCVAADATSRLMYMLSDESACIMVEVSDDVCAFATPHADVLLGYRREKELEIEQVFLPRDVAASDEYVTKILDQGLDELKDLTRWALPSQDFRLALDSKGAETVRRVKEFYERTCPSYPGHDGVDYALMQNVIAQTFLGKKTHLAALAATIPSSKMISRATTETFFGDYFPSRNSPICEKAARLCFA